MEVLLEKVAGLDVHQATVVAAVILGPANRQAKKEVRTFGTMTRDLLDLRQWLGELGVTHVGMESTGVYWKPVYALLEGDFELIVGNARHIKNVPGRKTDVKDSEWIANLVRHGLIDKSFVPPKPIRELRDLTRYRQKLAQAGAAERNRLLKLLETANIKLSSVASDVFGASGMAMLKALLEGEESPAEMAQLARGRLRSKLVELERALEGRVERHHRFLLQMQIRRIEQAEADLQMLDQQIDERLEPYREHQTRLSQVPGLSLVLVAVLISELGVDMSVFHSSAHLAAWAGVCPGSYESAGKNRRGSSRKGNVHLKTALVQAAIAASKTKDTYLHDKYFRLKAKRGGMRAAVAVGHKILNSAYQILANNQPYLELGATYLDQTTKAKVVKRMVRRIERLGFKVQLEAAAA